MKKDFLPPHSHDPNPDPPSNDPTITLTLPTGIQKRIDIIHLLSLPQTTISGCYIVSTGHGTSGPFSFTGPTLHTLIRHFLPNYFVNQRKTFQTKNVKAEHHAKGEIDVISGDGFGTIVWASELESSSNQEPILLACLLNHDMMTREQGLVRLIVPSERNDALRQIKWIGEIIVRS
ncbi:hypothetical protein KFU94_08920 [Chloroflexi bacterium TSY]|nr:hypothetical protein [Chloroflexi bacterium TSY]